MFFVLDAMTRLNENSTCFFGLLLTFPTPSAHRTSGFILPASYMARICDPGTMPDVAGVTKSGSAISCRKRQIRISPEHRPLDPALKTDIRLRLFSRS